MKNFKNTLAIAFSLLITPLSTHGFDVGGLVGDGEGGYSDVGFGGIAGSGDLGISDSDISGGFGVSSGGTSSAGGGSGSGSPSGDTFGGGEGNDNAYGDAGNDTLGGGNWGPEIPEQMIENSIKDKIGSNDIYGPTIDSIQRNVETELRDEIDKFNSTSNPTASEINNLGNQISEEVDRQLDGLSFLSGGITTGLINLYDYRIDDRSEVLTNYLVRLLKSSKMLDPITRLGLKGIKIVVMADLPNSFYARTLDAIFLSRKDIAKYGVVVLYHELMHAGLEKALRSGTISREHYNNLGNINRVQFADFDGYVGHSRGLFTYRGYGFQEALVIGWSYNRLRSYYKNLPEGMQLKSERYMADVLNNIKVASLDDGTPIHMISSTLRNKYEVHAQFIYRFTSGKSHLRTVILNTQKQVGNQLPNLCTPGSQKLIQRYQCGGGYSKDSAIRYQVCGNNYRYQAVQDTGCGYYDYSHPHGR